MIPGWKGLAVLGCLSALAGVILAALGSHAVPGMDQAGNFRNWQAASLLHLFHALALLALAALCKHNLSRLLEIAGLLMLLGTFMFSGSIYFMVWAGLESTGGIAPAGGLILMAGWLTAIAGVVRS